MSWQSTQNLKTLPKPGTKVLVVNRNHDKTTSSFFVKPQHIEARKELGTEGVYKGWVPGGGGDLWWVEHEDESVAAYCYDELLIEE